ncbi:MULTISPECIES: heat-inducible transcriptional repressor HrcA [unclassified Rathayibacter]|uniref:heat-inducible transcriptional repressor HrcA n=1 Tax=unclassified Rathayibacter TaxID=2609250 RepID=UPI000CE90A2E|nr:MULTISPECIES: heat-inducible transcriptional repressor HrcA [unclassified Rathayibacter]PPG48549.1 heat-inducible transcriptional repressor HrcA [Rathayibacter sp. AY2B3]PPI20581.1 heat-inducible transcriptional repressor HrcA [Rathayibacter sp. AY1B5]PPI21522.1 heat-inducible transcriptional repressor HrcA [Rathayibacter sp. AY1B6]PPI28919.1 heat-inducible transcriptional repressor HrcA [Rathayibacter sp. AY1B1]QHC70596.1 heat-inducible transcriptional repressor HrcA [Rathayibacter sp. VKM
MVTERGLQVLRVIVQDYVANREPVGSKSIVERHAFGVSAATIRNEMAQLEEEELIAAPHTSSGRVPTDKGYRLFVDQLADLRPLTSAQRQAIETFLGQSPDLDEVLVKTVRLLSQLTNSVALVQYPSFGAARLRHVELVALAPRRLLSVLITDTGRVDQRVLETPEDVDDALLGEIRAKLNTAVLGLGLQQAAETLGSVAERFSPERRQVLTPIVQTLLEQVGANRQDRLVMAGAANLVRTEEDFSGSIYPVLEAIEEQVELLRLFAEMTPDPRGISVRIGRENAPFGLQETSVLTSGYNTAGGQISRLGVLGPIRMDYSGNITAVRAVARYLSRLLGEE